MRWPAAGVAGRQCPPLALAEPFVDRLDDLFEGEVAVEVLLGGVPDLGVDDAVGREVLGGLGGDPEEGLAGLHDPDGVRERLQVPLQRAGVRGLPEPGAELGRVALGERRVPLFGGEFGDRAGAQATVEVVVEEHLRGAADLVGVRGGGHLARDLARHCGTVPPTRVDRQGRADTARAAARRYVTVTRRTGGVRPRF